MSRQELLFTHKPLDAQNNGIKAESYQNLIRDSGQNRKSIAIPCFFGFSDLFPLAETRINTGFFKQLDLFEFDRGGRFGRDIIDDAVDALDLVDDAHGDAIEHIVRDARPVGGHEVRRRDAAQRERIVIRAAVAHNTDRAHIRQHREVLIHRLLQVRLGDLVAEDEVRVAHQPLPQRPAQRA